MVSRSTRTGAAALLAVGVLAACATPDAPPVAQPAAAPAAAPAPAPAMTMRQRWETPTPPFRIAENVYYVGTLGLSSFLFTSPEGHVLLDGGLPENAVMIEASIAALGFRLSDVKILLNTHAHFDHSGGLARLKADTGARLLAMEGDVSALEGGFYLGSERIKEFAAPPVKVDGVLMDGDLVELGGTRLTARLTPGHSRGCTSWEFTARDGDASWRALVFCSATVAANRLVGPPQYDRIVADYRMTFARAKDLSVDMPLAAHPEFFGLIEKSQRLGAAPPVSSPPANPFVDPSAFPTLMAKLEADFERLLAEQTAAAGR